MFMPNSPSPPRGTTSSVAGVTTGEAGSSIRVPDTLRSYGPCTSGQCRALASIGVTETLPIGERQVWAAGSAQKAGGLNDFEGKTIAQRVKVPRTPRGADRRGGSAGQL